MVSNIDLCYVFLLMFTKKVKKVTDETALRNLCEFMLNQVVTGIVNKNPQPVPNVNAKLLEVALKLLHKSWKASFANKWPAHNKFRNQLVESVSQIMIKFPANDIYRA